MRTGERLGFSSGGHGGRREAVTRVFLTRMKHPPLDSPSSLSPPRCLVRTSSRAVCTRLSRRVQPSGVLPVLSRSLRICPSDRLAVCVVGLGLALVLVRWWSLDLVLSASASGSPASKALASLYVGEIRDASRPAATAARWTFGGSRRGGRGQRSRCGRRRHGVKKSEQPIGFGGGGGGGHRFWLVRGSDPRRGWV